eukprot:2895698-Heterocapsa_arctica.AAC.1
MGHSLSYQEQVHRSVTGLKKPRTFGGLWAVDAEELPVFDKQPMDLITEDEVRRVINLLADGKAKGVDGWSPAELRALSRTHIQGLADLLNQIEKEENGQMD